MIHKVSEAKIDEIMAIGGEFVATNLAEAMEAAFQDHSLQARGGLRHRERRAPPNTAAPVV